MTVAICCHSPEGIVLGADSTASFMVPGGGFHYLNHNQKIFEVGEDSSLGIVTWGLASLGPLSHRTQIALFADSLKSAPASSVLDAASRWIDFFWANYTALASAEIAMVQALHAKAPYNANSPPSAAMRTKDEEEAYAQLKMGLVVGFCFAGCHPTDRQPHAYEMVFDPLAGKPIPTPVAPGTTRCWGAPKIFDRMILGLDPDIASSIMASGKWNGTLGELYDLARGHALYVSSMPIRDSVDFVYSCVSATIKSLKFSSLSQICGGPIEIAVVTTDRPFRWVRHKEWDAAIREGHAR